MRNPNPQPMPSVNAPNHLTPNGAAALARRIEMYWAKKGAANVTARIETMTVKYDTIVMVRSNLINGAPPA